MNAEKSTGKVLPMVFPWNRRRLADQQGGIPIAPPELVVGLVLSEVFSALDRQDINERRMRSCTMIWVTGGAAVGVCPGYDDILVWLHPQTEGAMAVPMTAEAVDDFYTNVLPVIVRHKQAYAALDAEIEAANVDWLLLEACRVVREEGVATGDELPDRPNWEEMPGREPCSEAYAAAVKALADFLARHDAVPDPV